MTQLDVGYFMDQLHGVQTTLETLAITFETADDESELEWLLDMCTQPKGSLKDFASLKCLVLPQSFLFTTASAIWGVSEACRPKDLPSTLESLEILYPHEDVEEWISGFLHTDVKSSPCNVKEVTLTCRDEVGMYCRTGSNFGHGYLSGL